MNVALDHAQSFQHRCDPTSRHTANRWTLEALGFEKGPVDLMDDLASCCLVQSVDILCHYRNTGQALEGRNRMVPGVWYSRYDRIKNRE